ncbi:MAG: carboxylesterase, partial [Gammaproteobacteria bacterium]
STYLPVDEADQAVLEHNRSVPVFMAHGMQDPVVPYHWGQESARKLRRFGFDVEWREYAMAHSVSVEEIQDIGAWLTRVLSR